MIVHLLSTEFLTRKIVLEHKHVFQKIQNIPIKFFSWFRITFRHKNKTHFLTYFKWKVHTFCWLYFQTTFKDAKIVYK